MDILVLDADGVVNPLRFSDFSAFGLSQEMAAVFFAGPFKQCLVGADTKRALDAFAAEHGLTLDLAGLFAHWHEDQKDTHAQVVGTVRRLREHGVHAILATNQEPYRLAYMRERMGYGDIFDHIFCSSEIGTTKPDPRFFETIQAKLPVGLVRFIDDSQVNVDAARAYGWEGHCFAGDEAVSAQLRAWWPELAR